MGGTGEVRLFFIYFVLLTLSRILDSLVKILVTGKHEFQGVSLSVNTSMNQFEPDNIKRAG
jgi:hypothetical protein